jgi:cytochrome b
MQTRRQRIEVWDPFVRAFHWSLAAGYLAAWLTAEELPALHERLGYFVLMLIGLRLVWGIVGTRHARFADFVRGPGSALAYLRSLAAGRPQHYIGHNPAGGWMVILMLSTLAATAASGILMAGGDGEAWEELHEALANLSLLLVAVHVSGVVAASLLHRENLVGAMLTGRKWRGNANV